MSKTLLCLSLLCALPLTGCIIHIDDAGWDASSGFNYRDRGSSGPRRNGDGIRAQESRELASFDAVQATGFFDVVVEVGDEQRVTVHGDSNLIGYLRTEVRGGSLELSMEPGRYDTDQDLRVEVQVTDLRALAVTGSGCASVTGLDREAVAFTITGSGNLEVSGRVESVTLDCSGSGRADLSDLEARQVAVVVSGSSDVTVEAQDRLDVSISGSGDVRYSGRPLVSTSISGSGDVGPR